MYAFLCLWWFKTFVRVQITVNAIYFKRCILLTSYVKQINVIYRIRGMKHVGPLLMLSVLKVLLFTFTFLYSHECIICNLHIRIKLPHLIANTKEYITYFIHFDMKNIYSYLSVLLLS